MLFCQVTENAEQLYQIFNRFVWFATDCGWEGWIGWHGTWSSLSPFAPLPDFVDGIEIAFLNSALCGGKIESEIKTNCQRFLWRRRAKVTLNEKPFRLNLIFSFSFHRVLASVLSHNLWVSLSGAKMVYESWSASTSKQLLVLLINISPSLPFIIVTVRASSCKRKHFHEI